jgi:hypothetical protein
VLAARAVSATTALNLARCLFGIAIDEMLAWLGGPHDINKPAYDGTLSSLIAVTRPIRNLLATGSPAIPSAAR